MQKPYQISQAPVGLLGVSVSETSKKRAVFPLQWLFSMSPADRGILAATRPDYAQVLLELELPVETPSPPVAPPPQEPTP